MFDDAFFKTRTSTVPVMLVCESGVECVSDVVCVCVVRCMCIERKSNCFALQHRERRSLSQTSTYQLERAIHTRSETITQFFLLILRLLIFEGLSLEFFSVYSIHLFHHVKEMINFFF